MFPATQEQEQERVIAELRLLSYDQVKQAAQGASFEELEQLATAKGYKKGWVFHQLKTRGQLEEYAVYKNYSKKWVEYQIKL